jgi:hypothetical protein
MPGHHRNESDLHAQLREKDPTAKFITACNQSGAAFKCLPIGSSCRRIQNAQRTAHVGLTAWDRKYK